MTTAAPTTKSTTVVASTATSKDTTNILKLPFQSPVGNITIKEPREQKEKQKSPWSKPVNILSDASNKKQLQQQQQQSDQDQTKKKKTKNKKNKPSWKNSRKNWKNDHDGNGNNNNVVNHRHPNNNNFWNQSHNNNGTDVGFAHHHHQNWSPSLNYHHSHLQNNNGNSNFYSNGYNQNWNYNPNNNESTGGYLKDINEDGGVGGNDGWAGPGLVDTESTAPDTGVAHPFHQHHIYSGDDNHDKELIEDFSNNFDVTTSSTGSSLPSPLPSPSSPQPRPSWMDMVDSNTHIEGIVCRNIDEVTSKMITITTTAGASILRQLMMIKKQENSANSLTMGQQQQQQQGGPIHNNHNQAGDDGSRNIQPLQSRSGNTLNHQAPPFIHGPPPMMMTRLPPSPPPPPHMFRGADNNSGNNHLPPRFSSRLHAPMTPPLAPHGIGSGNRPPPPGFMMMPPHPLTGMMSLPHNSESGGMRPQMQMMHPHLPQGMMMPLGMQQQQSPYHPIPFGRVMENLEGGAVGLGNGNGAVPVPNHRHHHQQQQHQHQHEEDNNNDNNNNNNNNDNNNNNHNALTPRRENVVNPRRVSFSPFVPAAAPTNNNNGPN